MGANLHVGFADAEYVRHLLDRQFFEVPQLQAHALLIPKSRHALSHNCDEIRPLEYFLGRR